MSLSKRQIRFTARFQDYETTTISEVSVFIYLLSILFQVSAFLLNGFTAQRLQT